jgi:hypothetical protein
MSKTVNYKARRLTAVFDAVGLAVLILSGGCTGLGPKTVGRDNLAYGEAVGGAQQRQMLLNMVKLRYADAPTFLEVVSVINQYSIEGQVGVNTPGWDRPSSVGPPIGSASGRWSDRPTITYAPITGERFTKNLLTPIPPVALLSLIQSGWPANFVFGVGVRTINGISNGTRAALFRREPDPRFSELLEALTEMQHQSGIGIRIDRKETGDTTIVVMGSESLSGRGKAAQLRAREILGVDPGLTQLRLKFGPVAGAPDEISILSRSILEIIAEFSYGIEIPEEHLMEGRAMRAPDFSATTDLPNIRIRASKEKPDDMSVAVLYRDYWFSIDDRDFVSKRLFTFLVLLGSLADSDAAATTPLITVGS